MSATIVYFKYNLAFKDHNKLTEFFRTVCTGPPFIITDVSYGHPQLTLHHINEFNLRERRKVNLN